MDTNHPQDKQTPGGRHGAVVISRRRFARAGLSGSVILGSLASKPVLGAVPYRCTVSGQVSGNLSRVEVHGECDIGWDPAYWLAPTQAWPSPPFTKGTLPNNGCQGGTGTIFNGFALGGAPALGDAFFSAAGSSSCNVMVPPADRNPATMLQVLTQTNTGEQFKLGRVVVASLLNAVSLGVTYPVTAHTIIAMFNSTFNGGTYQAATNVFWARPRVIQYLESLYSPEGF